MKKKVDKDIELIVLIAGYGFTGTEVENRLKALNKTNSDFVLNLRYAYGNEQMRFAIFFKKTTANKFILDHLTAVYVPEIKLEHTITNGIDTAVLEEKMSLVPWKNWFKEYPTAEDKQRDKETSAILESFLELSKNGNYIGRKMQEKLLLKYFEDTGFAPIDIGHLRNHIEVREVFFPQQIPCFTIHLAYHILSGRLEALGDKIKAIGFEPYEELERKLSQNPVFFEINHEQKMDEGNVRVTVPVREDANGEYQLSYYTIQLKRHEMSASSVPITIQIPIDYPITRAYNLACGRSALIIEGRNDWDSKKWESVNFSNATLPIEIVSGEFYYSHIMALLQNEPFCIGTADARPFIDRLILGDRIKIRERTGAFRFIEANPEQRSLNIYDDSMLPLYNSKEEKKEKRKNQYQVRSHFTRPRSPSVKTNRTGKGL